MGFLNWQKFSFLWTPDSYVANSVEAVMNVQAGHLIGPIICRTEAAFDGTGTAAIFELGYGSNVDEFLDAGELDEETAGNMVRAIGAADGSYDTNKTFLFTAADTIDVNFTAATGADGTVGSVRIIIYWARVYP